jgi:hypothetical protein
MPPTARVEPGASALPALPSAPALTIVVLALAFRLAAALFGFVANAAFPDHSNQGFSLFARPHPFWDAFARFDAGWYFGIASGGYDHVAGGRNNLAFFPLYPVLMGGLGHAFGGRQEHFYIAGIVVSWTAFAAACVQLYRLALLDLTHEAAVRTVIYAAIFPSAFFFGVVYSESLFFLCLVTAALALRGRQWLLAGAALAAMTATRVNGVMFLPAFALLAWRAAGGDRRALVRGLAAVAAGLLGIAAYSAYTYVISGDPFEWYHSIRRWGYHPGGNPLSSLLAIGQAMLSRPVQYLQEAMAPYDLLNALAAAAALALVPAVLVRFGAAYAAVIVLGLALPLSSGQFEGLARYCSVLFPVAIYLGSRRAAASHLVLMPLLALLFGLCFSLFVNVHPLF